MRIDAAFDAAFAGRGATVLIEADAGIGKTSLLAETRAGAEAAGMTVLRGRGSQLESDYAMGVVRQCFEPELRARGDATSHTGLANVVASVILDLPDAVQPAPEAVRCCSRSTTPTGPMRPRFASLPTWRCGSSSCRSR